MTKSALEAAERLLNPTVYDGIKYLYDADIQHVAKAFVRISSERDEMVERCAAVADGYRDRARADGADYEVIEIAEYIAADIRYLSKPQEGGER